MPHTFSKLLGTRLYSNRPVCDVNLLGVPAPIRKELTVLNLVIVRQFFGWLTKYVKKRKLSVESRVCRRHVKSREILDFGRAIQESCSSAAKNKEENSFLIIISVVVRQLWRQPALNSAPDLAGVALGSCLAWQHWQVIRLLINFLLESTILLSTSLSGFDYS